MIFYLVSWMALQCPGGALKGFIPPDWKPFICERTPASALHVSSDEALAHIKKLGVGATVHMCTETKGVLKCEDVKISYQPKLEIK